MYICTKLNSSRRLFFALISFFLVALISGCAIAPGQDTYGMREQSSVKVPVKQESGEVIPANIKVREITAELLIEQMTDGESVEHGRKAMLKFSNAVEPVLDDLLGLLREFNMDDQGRA